MGILVCLGTDFLWKFLLGVWALKRIFCKPVTLKPIFRNKSGNKSKINNFRYQSTIINVDNGNPCFFGN